MAQSRTTSESAVAVTLRYHPLGVLQARTQALRLDGLFVDTGDVTLPCQSEVEVTLFLRHRTLEIHRLRAQVTGRSRRGTNLTFQNCRRETYQALQSVLSGTQE